MHMIIFFLLRSHVHPFHSLLQLTEVSGGDEVGTRWRVSGHGVDRVGTSRRGDVVTVRERVHNHGTVQDGHTESGEGGESGGNGGSLCLAGNRSVAVGHRGQRQTSRPWRR